MATFRISIIRADGCDETRQATGFAQARAMAGAAERGEWRPIAEDEAIAIEINCQAHDWQMATHDGKCMACFGMKIMAEAD